MKDQLKEILIHQLNECKIEPMEYIELNKYVDRMTNESIATFMSKVPGAKAYRYVNKLADKAGAKVGDIITKMSPTQKVLATGGALGVSLGTRQLTKRRPIRKIKEQETQVANAIQSRYPRAINNMQIKINSLEQQRIQNPALSLKINKQIARLRNIQNKYRVKQQVWMTKSMGRK